MYYNGCFFTKNPSQALSGKTHGLEHAYGHKQDQLSAPQPAASRRLQWKGFRRHLHPGHCTPNTLLLCAQQARCCQHEPSWREQGWHVPLCWQGYIIRSCVNVSGPSSSKALTFKFLCMGSACSEGGGSGLSLLPWITKDVAHPKWC